MVSPPKHSSSNCMWPWDFHTPLRLNFHHLNSHKFWHNFKNTINPMYSSSFEPEARNLYLLWSKLLFDLKLDLLNSTFAMNQTLKNSFDEQLVNVLLYGSGNFTFSTNAKCSRILLWTSFLNTKINFDNFAIVFTILFLFYLLVNWNMENLLRAMFASINFCVLFNLVFYYV